MPDSAKLLVGTKKGMFIYTSDRSRDRWQLSPPMLPGWSVFNMAADMRDGGSRLYAAANHFAWGPSVAKNTNGGEDWDYHSPGLGFPKDMGVAIQNIWSVAPGHKSQPGVVFAGTQPAGLFRSEDRGQHWAPVDGINRHPDRKRWSGTGGGDSCLHSIEIDRFSEPNEELEAKARLWRHQLDIPDTARILLYAGKFDRVKRPIELMTAGSRLGSKFVLLMVGNGQLEEEVQRRASETPEKFRILPFQNQSVMPVVYRLADVYTLPSASETWGLAVNEALASGRRVLISDRVGCAPDLIRSEMQGEVFRWNDWDDFEMKARRMLAKQYDETTLRSYAREFDISVTERTLCETLTQVLATLSNQARPA